MYNIFKGAFSTESIKIVDLNQVHTIIKSDYMRKHISEYRNLLDTSMFHAKQYKNNLLCFTYGGTFENGKKIENLVNPSGLMIMDFDDHKEDYFKKSVKCVDAAMLSIRDYIESLPETQLCFSSPSGGLKFAVQTDVITTNNQEYGIAYDLIMKHYEQSISEALDIDFKLDSSCKNINRLCYLSYDEECYYNATASTYNVKSLVETQLDVIEKQQRKQRLKHEKQALEREARGLVIDDEKQSFLKQKSIDFYMSKYNVSGSRHLGSFILGSSLFQIGLSKFEVEQVFQRLKMNQAYTEELSPRNKANDIYKEWINNGSEMNNRVFKTQNTGLFL